MLDIWNYISCFIEKDRDKCHLLSVSKELSQCKFYFNEKINTCLIKNLSRFDYFTNVSNINNIKKKNQPTVSIPLPLHITHLTFSDNFNKELGNYIPSSVINLSFGRCFNKSINGHIPSSVKYLSLGWNFNRSVDNLPSSITHLKFGFYYNETINNFPPSLEYLQFGAYFNKP